jgi:hypothetical protein
MSSKRTFGLDADEAFCVAYMRAGGYLQKYYADDMERISNRIKRKRAKRAVPLWDWDQTYEVRVPGMGWNVPIPSGSLN